MRCLQSWAALTRTAVRPGRAAGRPPRCPGSGRSVSPGGQSVPESGALGLGAGGGRGKRTHVQLCSLLLQGKRTPCGGGPRSPGHFAVQRWLQPELRVTYGPTLPQAGGGGMEPLARAGSAWGRWPLTGPRLTLSIYLPQSLNFRGRERTPGAMTIVLSRGPGWRGLCPTSPWSTRLSIRTDPQVPVCCGSGPPPSPLSGHSSSRPLGGCGQRPARVWRRITVFTTRRNPGARGPMRKGTGRPQVPFSF